MNSFCMVSKKNRISAASSNGNKLKKNALVLSIQNKRNSVPRSNSWIVDRKLFKLLCEMNAKILTKRNEAGLFGPLSSVYFYLTFPFFPIITLLRYFLISVIHDQNIFQVGQIHNAIWTRKCSRDSTMYFDQFYLCFFHF